MTLSAGANFDVDAIPESLDETAILAVLDRVFPEWYLEPLRNPGPGYEWYQAAAAMLARASTAAALTEAALFVLYSHGGANAEADVEFFRSSTTSGAFLVLAGTVVRTSRTNRSFQVVSDVAFGSGDLVATGRVRAVAPASEYNVTGPIVTADGTTLPGEIDSVVIPILDPVLAEPTIQVRQITDATGGRAAVLDQHGADRNIIRVLGEPDEIYKGRIRQLPDTVSPAALRRQLDSVFLPMGLGYQLIETWHNSYVTCYDAPDFDIVHHSMGTVVPDCFVFDDPRTEVFRGRLMDERDHIAGLIVVVPEVGPWSERSMAFDDPGTPGPGSTSASRSTLDLENFHDGTPLPVPTDSTPWDAVFESTTPGDAANGAYAPDNFVVAGLCVFMSFDLGAALIEVRDRQRFDTLGAGWVDEDSGVGILVRSTVPVAVSVIEAAFTASTLVRVRTHDTNPAKEVVIGVFSDQQMLVIPLADGVTSNVTARGWRARSVLDAPDRDGDADVGQFTRVPFLDGYDLLHDQFYKRLAELLHQIKGGGTNSVIELEGQ